MSLFLLMKDKVKLSCYVQTPFRLIFLMPSISVIFPVISSFGILTTTIAIVVVVLSEVAKIYSLRKWA